MEKINWQDVVNAIRENRFEDLTAAIRAQVADKIEANFLPKRKGRPPEPKAGTREWYEWCDRSHKARSRKITADRAEEIAICYRQFRDNGAAKGEATVLVAEKLGISKEGIEAVMTATRDILDFS